MLPDAGRRNPQLIARLSELSTFLASTPGLDGDMYADLSGQPVDMRNEAAPALEPYRALDVSRLRLIVARVTGTLVLSSPRICTWPTMSLVLCCMAFPLLATSCLCARERASLKLLPWLACGMDLGFPTWSRLSCMPLIPTSLPKLSIARRGPIRIGRLLIDGVETGQKPDSVALVSLSRSALLGMLEVEPFRQTLLSAATDRKDFYHQLAVSQSKAASNALGPALPRTLVATAAFAAASLSQGRRAGLTREQRGDCLKEVPPNDLGVEVAACAHGNLLEEGGLLDPGSRLCSKKPLGGDREAQGVVIDDYFSVCVHDLEIVRGASLHFPPCPCQEGLCIPRPCWIK